MTCIYLRQYAGCKNLVVQQKSVVQYALQNGIDIDKEVIEHTGGNKSIEARKEFEEFLHSLSAGDNLIIDEIWVLSCRVDELVKVIGCALSRDVNIHIAQERLILKKETPLGLVISMINNNKKIDKKDSKYTGRPKGSLSKSKFDVHLLEILKALKERKSISAIARDLGVSRSSLKDYILSRELKTLALKGFFEVDKAVDRGDEGRLLICPFEKDKKIQ